MSGYTLAEKVRCEAKTIFARAALMASWLPVVFLLCEAWTVHAELHKGLPALPEGMRDEEWDEWVRGLVPGTRPASPWYVPYPRVYRPVPGLGIIVPLVPPGILDTRTALAGKPAR